MEAKLAERAKLRLEEEDFRRKDLESLQSEAADRGEPSPTPPKDIDDHIGSLMEWIISKNDRQSRSIFEYVEQNSSKTIH